MVNIVYYPSTRSSQFQAVFGANKFGNLLEIKNKVQLYNLDGTYQLYGRCEASWF